MIDTIIDGKYRVIRLLGQGGMGSVYEAEQTETGARAAIKVIHSDQAQRSPAAVARFHREARAAAAIDTEHITQVVDSGTDARTGLPYIVLELLEGEDLQALLDRVSVLPPEIALRIAAQACLGLVKAHEARVVHRDIKPGNLFLARRGDEIVVKLLDFGVAKIKPEPSQGTQTTGLTSMGALLGSPLYMAPEQARGLKSVDHPADLWSLGVVLYRSLTGRAPHEDIQALGELIMALCSEEPRPVREVAPWVPPDVAAVVHGALRISPGERFPSAAAMLDAIQALLPGGHALRPEMLAPLDAAARAVVQRKLDVTMIDASAPAPAKSSAAPAPVTPPSADIRLDDLASQRPASTRAELPPAPPPRASSSAPLIVAMVLAVALAAFGVYKAIAPGASPPFAPSPTVTPTAVGAPR